MRRRTTRYLRIGLIPASIVLAGIVVSRLRSLFQPIPPSTPIFIAADHPHIHYVGRWDLRDASHPTVGWQGATITLQFEGTALSTLIRPQYSHDYIRVIIDGVVQPTIEISANDDPVVIARGLSAGTHRIDIVKETYQGGDMTVAGFWLTGTLIAPPPALPHHIVFLVTLTSLESRLATKKTTTALNIWAATTAMQASPLACATLAITIYRMEGQPLAQCKRFLPKLV